MLTRCCSPERLCNARSASLQSCPQLVDENIDRIHVVRIQLLLRLEICGNMWKSGIEIRLAVAYCGRDGCDRLLPNELLGILRCKAHEDGNCTYYEELYTVSKYLSAYAPIRPLTLFCVRMLFCTAVPQDHAANSRSSAFSLSSCSTSGVQSPSGSMRLALSRFSMSS